MASGERVVVRTRSSRGRGQIGDQVGHRLHQMLAVVEHQQRRGEIELLGDPCPDVGALRRRERTAAGDRVADPERRPDLADQVFWRGHADQLDEVHHRLRSLTGDGMREPGLAEPARAEDRDHPRGGEQRPHPPEVVVAAEQRGRVEPHPDAYGAVERQQRTVHPPQLRADVGADPVAQVRPITLEAVERGARSTHRRLAVQEIGEQSLVLGVEARGLLELGQRDVVVAAPAPRPGEHDPRGRQVVFRAQAHLGQRAVTLRRRRPGAQRERLLGRRPRRGRILGEQRRRPVRQGVQPPGVDAVGRDVEPVSAPSVTSASGPTTALVLDTRTCSAFAGLAGSLSPHTSATSCSACTAREASARAASNA